MLGATKPRAIRLIHAKDLAAVFRHAGERKPALD